MSRYAKQLARELAEEVKRREGELEALRAAVVALQGPTPASRNGRRGRKPAVVSKSVSNGGA